MPADQGFGAGAKALAQVAVEHLLAARFPGLPGEPGADEASDDGGWSQQPRRLAVSAKHQDEDVGAARDGKRDGSRIEHRDGENTGDTEVENPGRHEAVMRLPGYCFGCKIHAW